jgi:hypothetical protein
MWEKSCSLNPDFPTAYRNLALYYANKQHDYSRTETELEKAFNKSTHGFSMNSVNRIKNRDAPAGSVEII